MDKILIAVGIIFMLAVYTVNIAKAETLGTYKKTQDWTYSTKAANNASGALTLSTNTKDTYLMVICHAKYNYVKTIIFNEARDIYDKGSLPDSLLVQWDKDTPELLPISETEDTTTLEVIGTRQLWINLEHKSQLKIEWAPTPESKQYVTFSLKGSTLAISKMLDLCEQETRNLKPEPAEIEGFVLPQVY